MAIDIAKAFDRVPIPRLLHELSESTLPPNIIRWLRSYLRGRQAACIFQSSRSSFRKIHFGVPQGSCISPVLFNFYVRDFPDCAELTISYADNFTILESAVDLGEIDEKLCRDLRRIEEWAERKELTISATKSSVTFFSTDSHQHNHHPQVYLGGNLIPLVKTPKILGVTLDPQLTFGPHAKVVVDNMGGSLNVIKAVAERNGEALRRIYRSPIRLSRPACLTMRLRFMNQI